ncbi:putative protein ApaG-like [Cocos nucifera]|uniref:UVR domain-containing protein n=1 Tax=Cocos nucifera TaxID=13894 RepID=A0A8K0N2L0_COCNU|nr:putative protein ApaG-like [Cocos nucifera]
MAVSSSNHSSPSERDGTEGGDDGIVGSEGDKTAASFLSRSQTYSLLKQQMAVAAKFEDYKEAARIRDSLKSFEEEEPVLRLRRLMRKAIDEESVQS